MAVIVAVFLFILLQGVDSQTVTITRSPTGTPVSGMPNTFDYPILSSVTLTCTASSGSNYRWSSSGCYTNTKFTGSNPQCFPHGRTGQSVTRNNLDAENAATITCTARISGSDYTSEPFTLRISGVAVTRTSLLSTDVLPVNALYVNARSGNGDGGFVARCVSGLGPSSSTPGGTSEGANGLLGGLYFNDMMIPNSGESATCGEDVIQVRPGATTAGVTNFHQCQPFTTAAEGVYTCTMMNSSMMDQSVRFGIYFTGRTAPMINAPSSDTTMTVEAGSSLTLSCTSQDSPPDTFTWRKDNNPTVLQSTSITAMDYTSANAVFRANYSIESVTTSDSGTYTCTVTNPIGSDSATIMVVVTIPYTVTIVSDTGTRDTGSATTTYDYRILSSVTLTCNVSPSPSTVDSYRWGTTGCYTNSKFTPSNPQCFPRGQTTESVTGNDLNAEDAGTITCHATINGEEHDSEPFTLRISGVVVTDALQNSNLNTANELTDYSYINARSGTGSGSLLARCVTGLGPTGTNNGANGLLGGLYFNGTMISNSREQGPCSSDVIQVRPGRTLAGVTNFHQCDTFTTNNEGVYTCTMMNSLMMNESVRFGIYFSTRMAPVIDTPSSSTVTVNVGESLTLSCTSLRSPPDTFTWMKGNGPILQSTTTPVTYNVNNAVFRSDYFKDMATTSDNGTYTCTVTNPIGSDSATITVTVINVHPPTMVMAMVLGPRTVEVTWMASLTNDVTGYLVSYTTTVDYADDGIVTVNGGSTTSQTLTSLEEDAPYTITVQATTDDDDRMSANSNEVSVRTYTDVPSSPPRDVTVVSHNPASLIVSWRPPTNRDRNGPITGYTINYTRVGSSDVMSINVTGPSVRTGTISKLAPFVNYSVIVAAMTVNGTGPFINSSVVGRSGEDLPSEVRSLEIISFNSSSVTIQWRSPESPNGVVTHYSLQLNEDNIVNISSNVLMYTNGGLSPDTVYVLQLRAHTGAGAGPSSNKNFVTYPAPVSNIIVSNNSESFSTFILTWMEVNLTTSMFSHYTVFYLPLRGPYDPIMASNRKKRQSAEPEELTMNFTETTGTLTNLNGSVTYRIQMAVVVTINGQKVTGDRSDATEMTTSEGVPTAPRDLMHTSDITGNMFDVTLTWNRPDPPNGVIIQYNVSFISTGTDSQNHTIQTADIDSSINSSHTWIGLTRGQYQFSVVAFTSKGPGDIDSVDVSTIPNSDSSSSGGGSGGAVAGGVIGGLLAVVIIIIIVIVVLLYMRRRKGESTISGSKGGTVTNSGVVPLKDITDGKQSGSYEPEIIGLPSKLAAVEGQSFSFPSHVTGKPVPDVYWYLNSRDMTEDDAIVISSNGQLTLTSVSTDHVGEWRCQATNSSGSTEAKTNLTVTPIKVKPLPSPRPDRKHKPIPVNDFGAHVTMLHEHSNQGFKAEYDSFYNGEGMSTAIGAAAVNKHKNRFANIVAYDENRVVLSPCGAFKDDYVNASPLDGYKQPRCYIAAQAPVAKTLTDFWRLVWQEHPPTIVMVTNLKEGEKVKCVQYWPDAVGQSQTFGPLNVSLTEEYEFADYVVRTIELKNTELGNRLHVVTQYHFTAWPDHGVPDYATAILAFHRRLRGTHHPSIGPMLVHCSAGVGRTGTLLTIDIALEQVKAEGAVGIYNVVDKMRHQRPHMVQSQEQYMFIHDAILESITCGNTQVSAADLQRTVTKLKQRDPNTKLTGYEQQFKVLTQVSPRIEDQVCSSALKNPEKNRPNHCYPLEKGRVILRKEKSDYINANFLKGYKQDKAFIVAQSPMQNTVRDFWKMIHDRQCASIVMLCEIMEDGREACAPYWPESGAFTYGDMTVTIVSAVEAKEFTTRVFKITDNASNSTHQVTQFHYHSWGAHKAPVSAAGLITLIDEVQRVQRSTANKPIVVHCSNVLGRTGTFCAIFTILERFKVEQVIDVLQTVKLLRIKRPGIVEDLDQYQFIFTVVVRFLQSFDTYDNFKI